jgi:hypothetical protein
MRALAFELSGGKFDQFSYRSTRPRYRNPSRRKRLLQGAAIGAVVKQFDIASAQNKEPCALAETATGISTIKIGASKVLFPKAQEVPKYRIRNKQVSE